MGLGTVVRGFMVVLAAATMAGGCATGVEVRSTPAGAEIVLDGKPIGRTTPAKLTLDDLKEGEDHLVAVQMIGYRDSAPQGVRVKVSGGRIFWTCFLPVPFLIINGIRGWEIADPGVLKFRLDEER